MTSESPAQSELFSKYQTSPQGLTDAEAAKRLQTNGPNALTEGKKKSFLMKIWDQIKDPMVLVLLAAAGLSGALDEIVDMAIILAVVILNTVIGLLQESKAEKAIEALKKMSAQQAKVVRQGRAVILPAEELVVGDIVLIEAGDVTPADLTLIQSSSLRIEEASLTGESVPSEKDASLIPEPGCPLGDRVNMAFYSTGVAYGRGSGVVTATGMDTEMGRIAGILNAAKDESTPLQKKLGEIGKLLTVIVLGICVVVFFTGIFKNGGFTLDNTLESFLISVSLAVAAIPEGLPAVVTIVMALGVTRMARQGAIVRKLPAVETLGCTDIICSDKTGTLTQNKMTVRQVYADGRQKSADDFLKEEDHLLCDVLYLCNDSTVNSDGEMGDPTETALKRFVLQKHSPNRYGHYTRTDEVPFDSVRKRMATVNNTPQGPTVFVKGAPDELLKVCDRILLGGAVSPLTDSDREKIMDANRSMAEKALRVLGGAYKPDDGGEREEGLIFAGLVGMIDPPRPEVYEAVKSCRRAGIVPIMITGDHKDTAIAVAKEVGILSDPAEAIFGSELDTMSDEELDERLPHITVYSRVSPEHKVRIVRAWKKRDKVVAMTGDGVNDAPALKAADIGVGMGITGTDVSKGVSDMLLTDDNFATIVRAVEEGRKIYHNIRKSVQFLLSANISEVIAIFTATLLLPPGIRFLSPVHILWINLVTDSVPAIGLGLEGAEKGIMDEPPRPAKESFFAGGMGLNILVRGVTMASLTLLSYWIGYGTSPEVGTTMAFVTMAFSEIFYSFAMKSLNTTVFSPKTFNNPVLLSGLVVPLVTVAMINVPSIASIFSVVPLDGMQWFACVGLALLTVPLTEAYRVFRIKFLKH